MATQWLLEHLRGGVACWDLVAVVSSRHLVVLGLSLVSGVTAMSTSDHWLNDTQNLDINENIHLLMQSWLGRVVGGLGGAGA
jgi:hypothetical protein